MRGTDKKKSRNLTLNSAVFFAGKYFSQFALNWTHLGLKGEDITPRTKIVPLINTFCLTPPVMLYCIFSKKKKFFEIFKNILI